MNKQLIYSWLVLVLICPPAGLHAAEVDISTPEKALAVHYQAYRTADIELLRQVHPKVDWIDQAKLREISAGFLNYQILTKKTEKADSVYLRVKERHKGGSSVMHFGLTKVGSKWLIDVFNSDEEARLADDSAVSITSISPREGHVGTGVTISGHGFSDKPSENSVLFAADKLMAPATVISASSSKLIVIVPTELKRGNIATILLTNENGVASSKQHFTVLPKDKK
jgi:hypothetical protein